MRPTVEATSAPIDERDWLILNALSDDYESVEQIVQLVNTPTEAWPEVTPLEVIDRLERLYRPKHVLLILDAIFDRQEMVREIDQIKDRRFWFGARPPEMRFGKSIQKIFARSRGTEPSDRRCS
jgi:hypothetical protein